MELAAVWRSHPQHRDVVRLALSAVGRGGSSDLGQRIRDDILVVQSANNAKGGMMEQWHQKVLSPISSLLTSATHSKSNSDLRYFQQSYKLPKWEQVAYQSPGTVVSNFRVPALPCITRSSCGTAFTNRTCALCRAPTPFCT